MDSREPTASALDARRAAWVEAVRSRDIDRYAGLLSPGVVWFPPGQPAVEGVESFRAWVKPFFERFTYEFALESVDCRLAGSFAHERGRFTTVMTPLGGGEPMRHTGSYLVLWRHDATAGWRIDRYLDVTWLDS